MSANSQSCCGTLFRSRSNESAKQNSYRRVRLVRPVSWPVGGFALGFPSRAVPGSGVKPGFGGCESEIRARFARRDESYLVDPASSHMLVSKIKPCMSKYKLLYCETANGSLNQLSSI